MNDSFINVRLQVQIENFSQGVLLFYLLCEEMNRKIILVTKLWQLKL